MSHYVADMLCSVSRCVHRAYANVSNLHGLQILHLDVSASFIAFHKSASSNDLDTVAPLLFPPLVPALMIPVMMSCQYIPKLSPLSLLQLRYDFY